MCYNISTGGGLDMERTIISYLNEFPEIDESVFLADGVRIIGKVKIEKDCVIWFNSVLRGDVGEIRIGEGTNIQDNSTVHVGRGIPCIVGKNVTVGHNVLLHGCTIGDSCLIGMGSIVMTGVEIGEFSIVAAGSLITQKKKFPPNSLIMGNPAQVVRPITEEEKERIILGAGAGYRRRAVEYSQDKGE